MIKKEDFDKTGGKDIKEDLYNFLLKNRNNAYTLKEIKDNFDSVSDDIVLHMDLTRLIWEGKVSYKDIYDHNDKLVRYYMIDKKSIP